MKLTRGLWRGAVVWPQPHHHMTGSVQRGSCQHHPWEQRRQRKEGRVGWSQEEKEEEAGKCWVSPSVVQSRPAAVILCIFQTHLNGPGWGVGRPAGGRKRGSKGGGLNSYILFLTDSVYTVETWPLDYDRGRDCLILSSYTCVIKKLLRYFVVCEFEVSKRTLPL